MNNTFPLTIKEVLKRPVFQGAEVIAGHDGLSRPVRWVHIMEVTEIGHLLNGNELILSTGIGWKNNPRLALSLLEQMVEKDVSGLCLELGTYVNHLPEELIRFADKHQFPIIIFKEKVRFIDITQDLHRLSIQNQYDLMLRLESASNQFNHLLLAANSFRRILRLIHQYLRVQVAYHSVDGKIEFYPNIDPKLQKDYMEKIKAAQPNLIINSSATSASKPVQAMGRKFGDLIIISEKVLTDFDYLVLERAATALSLDRMRLLYTEEKKRQKENDWILAWLRGEHSKETIVQFLNELDAKIMADKSLTCLCEIDSSDRDLDLTYYSTLFQNIFMQHGFFPLTSYKRSYLIFVLLNREKEHDYRNRLKQALAQIYENKQLKKYLNNPFRFAAGKLLPLEKLNESYEQAKKTIYLQKKMNLSQCYFYDDLYVYQIILQLDRQNELQELVDTYLGPVIQFDQERNGDLLRTLSVLLEVNGSKKDAAERLFIVRQTLYHRIEKIKELLGEDFMESEKRLAIEFALYAHQFLRKKISAQT